MRNKQFILVVSREVGKFVEKASLQQWSHPHEFWPIALHGWYSSIVSASDQRSEFKFQYYLNSFQFCDKFFVNDYSVIQSHDGETPSLHTYCAFDY